MPYYSGFFCCFPDCKCTGSKYITLLFSKIATSNHHLSQNNLYFHLHRSHSSHKTKKPMFRDNTTKSLGR